MTDSETRRTTVLLRQPQDTDNLEVCAAMMGTTDTEVIRRGLKVLRELLVADADDWQIILEKDSARTRIILY